MMLAPLAALTACNLNGGGKVVPTGGSALHPTAFGSQIYPTDDIGQTMALLAGCGSSLIRVGADSGDSAYFDQLFPAAAAHGIRVIVISAYASQPVDLTAYAASAVAFQKRYGAYNPIWEIWNEPNLAHYWGANPDVGAYSQLAIATATALRSAGAREILSGGTSGIDVGWLYDMRTRGVFDAVTGCAVHSYKSPALAQNEYLQAASLMPPGIALYTTEACVQNANDQPTFFRDMWYIHRELNLPAMVWCEFRDGTAGPKPPYTDPYGLVTASYQQKNVYSLIQKTLMST
ncbi:MAG TPA: hypothetical protein VE591_00480 [Candidatus Acidoferrum sp.]|nr:hypothetical protein [Candidatus Acidoferrum sp.]